MLVKPENIKNRAGDKIPNQINLLKKFKLSIFWVIWYKEWKNEANLIDFLNYSRKKKEETLKIINNKDYNSND